MERGMDIAIGLIAALLVPWLVWTMRRGLREGRLPIGRSHVVRAERPGPFYVMFALYVAILVAVTMIAADLLFGLNLRGAR
jgi:hypothetical protein